MDLESCKDTHLFVELQFCECWVVPLSLYLYVQYCQIVTKRRKVLKRLKKGHPPKQVESD